MASRISHRSRRSSRSLVRLTSKRARGTAAEARMLTMVTVMRSSIRVRPASGTSCSARATRHRVPNSRTVRLRVNGPPVDFCLAPSTWNLAPLLHMHDGLRTCGGQRDAVAVVRGKLDQSQVGIAGSNSAEVQYADLAFAGGDAGGAWR